MLVHNDKVLKKAQLVQEHKLLKLGYKELDVGHDPEQVIFNYSSHVLTDAEKRLLSKGLSFSIPPKSLHHGDALLPFEKLFQLISKDENVSPHSIASSKALLQHEAFSMLNNYSAKSEQNLSADEVGALKSLRADKSIVIQKSDKGNSVVILDRCAYLQGVEVLLADTSKFRKLNVLPEKDYNYIWNQELRVRQTLNNLVSSKAISEELCSKLVPSGSRPGVMYGLSKVHKPLVNGFPKLRPILSAINTPTYNLAKFLVSVMAPLTTNCYTVKDSVSFAADIRSQNTKYKMCSFDVDALFTNIPLDETIDICCEELFKDTTEVSGMTKCQFRSLLELATKESFILFNGSYYQQIDGVAMGSPLGPTLANVFLCFHEKKWLSQCPGKFRPMYFKRYVDDIFCLFRNESHIQSFLTYLNSCHGNMTFTHEMEIDDHLPFLDVSVIRSGTQFITSVYRKPTFSGVYTNFGSFIPELYKFNLISTLLFRIVTICSGIDLVQKEVAVLKSILRRNAYPRGLVDELTRKFFDRFNSTRTPIVTVPKQDLVVVLPYLGSVSNKIKHGLKSLAKKYLTCSNIVVIFKSRSRLSSVLNFKDKLPAYLLSGVVYKFTCSSCNATYVGKTKRHVRHRFAEHAGRSPLSGKLVKGQQSTTVRDHMLVCDTLVCDDNFEIVCRDSNNMDLKIKESLFIKKERPTLNVQGNSVPLRLF